jgi:hypothetical protein
VAIMLPMFPKHADSSPSILSGGKQTPSSWSQPYPPTQESTKLKMQVGKVRREASKHSGGGKEGCQLATIDNLTQQGSGRYIEHREVRPGTPLPETESPGTPIFLWGSATPSLPVEGPALSKSVIIV